MTNPSSMAAVTQAIDNLKIEALTSFRELVAELEKVRAERDTWRAKATAAGATS